MPVEALALGVVVFNSDFGFFPVAINFLRRVPLLGTFLNLPGVSAVSSCKFHMSWVSQTKLTSPYILCLEIFEPDKNYAVAIQCELNKVWVEWQGVWCVRVPRPYGHVISVMVNWWTKWLEIQSEQQYNSGL
ncbi:hypothetical protein NQ317_006809 [Molorchus minor]|uniref:Uncharacterized protein n=1 Tax=Molorchus minor TaxID=1323400 RepID=A0ABQ9JFW2_9CUCU|nr:hypothetical protein NQ317_006809 [Molorchus minor]